MESPFFGYIQPFEWQEPVSESDLDPSIDDLEDNSDQILDDYPYLFD